jgi:hypothetical protein
LTRLPNPSPSTLRASLTPVVLGFLALAMLALIALGLFQPDLQVPLSPRRDVDLYAHFVAFARHPLDFYPAAVAEQRREGYVLHPFVTVRPPAMAFLLALMPGNTFRKLAIAGLGLAVMAAWGLRLTRLGVRPWVTVLAVALVGTGVVPNCIGRAFLFHESWAGLLIALSLAVYGPRSWLFSLALGLAAALIRELSAPFLLAMAACALMEGRRREAGAWAAAIAVFALALGFHAWMVTQNVRPDDLDSPGWAHLTGWAFILSLTDWNLLLAGENQAWAAITTPLVLFGAVVWSGPTGRRVGLTIVGFMTGFMFIGRPENYYWGLLLAPILPLAMIMGLYLAPGLARLAWTPRTSADGQ